VGSSWYRKRGTAEGVGKKIKSGRLGGLPLKVTGDRSQSKERVAAEIAKTRPCPGIDSAALERKKKSKRRQKKKERDSKKQEDGLGLLERRQSAYEEGLGPNWRDLEKGQKTPRRKRKDG